jgi:acyl-CoA dehydrogenase
MEIIKYTEAHNQFRAKARKFMEEEVIPHVEQWEKDRIVPRSFYKKMGQAGFLCPTVSKTYGGPGLDFLHSVIINDEISRTNHNGCGPILHSEIVAPYIESFASEACKHKYLPGCVSGDIILAIGMTEPNTGSDLAAITTTAEDDGDHVIVNGAKIFISNGINCDLLVLAAKDPLEKNPHKAVSLYLVDADTPGFKKGNKLAKMGWHSQDTLELFFTNCRVPKANMLGEKGHGFSMLMKKLQQERLMTALWGVIAAEYILENGLKYYRENSGEGKPVPRSQVNQFSLVEMATEVKIGRTFVDKLIVDHMEGKDIVVETSMAKFWTTEMARRVANGCMDLLAEVGVYEHIPIVRSFLGVRSMSIFAGTNEIMRRIVAKYMNL